MTTTVIVDEQGIVDDIVRAAEDSTDEIRQAMPVPRRTGALAASIDVVAGLDADGNVAIVATSSVPYGRAVVLGSNVGPRPGPHMSHGEDYITPALQAAPDIVARHVREGA